MKFIRWIVLIVVCLLPAQSFAQETRWFEVSSANFVVVTDTSETKARRLVMDLESRLGLFANAFGPVPQRQFPVQIFVFSRAEDFLEAVPSAGTARIDKDAYFQKGPDRTFVVARDKSPEDILDDVGHALGHHIFERYVLWRPFWLAEAAGEYFRKVGRDADTKAVSADDRFTVADLLTIVPSSAYVDTEPGGPFRTQSFRLLQFLVSRSPNVVPTFLQVLRGEEGYLAKPDIDAAALDASFQAYVETPLVPSTVQAEVMGSTVDPSDVEIRRGELLLAMGKSAEAGQWFNANTPRARGARAILTTLSRTTAEATRTLERAAREEPDNGLVQFHFGAIETQVPKDVQLQVEALERAVVQLPLFGRAYAELARVYLLTGSADKSLVAIDRAIRLEPEYAARFYDLRSEALLALKQLDEAQKTIELASSLPHADRATAELYERKVSAMARKIETVRRAADAERAEQLREQTLRRAVEVDPPKPVAPPPTPRREGVVSFQIESSARVEVLNQVFPDYPDALIQKGAGGNVTLQMSVGADGKVTNVRVASSQLADMNTASIEAARRWTFRPVSVSGRAVPFSVRLIFQYVSQ